MRVKTLITASLIIVSSNIFSSSLPQQCPSLDDVNAAIGAQTNGTYKPGIKIKLTLPRLGEFTLGPVRYDTIIGPGRMYAFESALISENSLTCTYLGQGEWYLYKPANNFTSYRTTGNWWGKTSWGSEICDKPAPYWCLFFVTP